MDTTTDIDAYMHKSADGFNDAVKGLKSSLQAMWEGGGGAVGLATLLGLLGGAGIGTMASYMKNSNPKITALDRKRKFYSDKLEEMSNENWLNDLMSVRRKLETSKLSDDDRTKLENRYLQLINRNK